MLDRPPARDPGRSGAAPVPGEGRGRPEAAGIGAGSLPEAPARRAYAAYRRREARRLLDLLPEEAVRPLYRRAREWAGRGGGEAGPDLMETLVRFCERLLPLPPFAVWAADVLANSDAHLDAGNRDPEFDRSPLPVEVRRLRSARGEGWQAALNIFRDDEAWRGFVSFHVIDGSRSCRTADIFREESAEAVVTRFRSFDERALQAFLRSVLP